MLPLIFDLAAKKFYELRG